MTSHDLFMTSCMNMYDITPSMFMTSYPIYMISPILHSWQHNDYTWHLTHYICHPSHSICVVICTLSMPSQQVWKSPHLAHVWHNTHSKWHHIHILWHQSSVFMTSEPLHSWHQISYIWHHIHGLWHLIPYSCHITQTISVTSHPICLWIHIHYLDIKHTVLRQYNHYIWHHNFHISICLITPTLSMI